MSSISTTFAEALGTVSRPGTFFVTGSEQTLAPGLEVEGIGPVGLPLPAVQAEQLIAVAERAPYGRGEETVIDTAVRRSWQIGADRVRITGRHWPATLRTIVTRVTEGLGVTDPIEAELYKMLIYDAGSFFVPHRDTEKTPGMFATLVLILPSVSEGGALIVRHKDREARLELRCEDPSDVAFGAFYADCVHEVLPVTAAIGWFWSIIWCAAVRDACRGYRTTAARWRRSPTVWNDGRRRCGPGMRSSPKS
jgi:predicted 2-oxoglutarate/Fe(II)-dependent dioxygenase YbiX